jgi:hypothetical protein
MADDGEVPVAVEREVFDIVEVQLNAAAERDGCLEMAVQMLYLKGIAA